MPAVPEIACERQHATLPVSDVPAAVEFYVYNVGAPIDIERVDVPVRLEKRLAALLTDLAAFKRMSVGSCLEETLLHTMWGVTPHTSRDLRYIETLIRKHGIDYDSHGSYRFIENGER